MDLAELNVSLRNDVLKQVHKLKYLGRTVTSKRDLEPEISSRIGAVSAAFG